MVFAECDVYFIIFYYYFRYADMPPRKQVSKTATARNINAIKGFSAKPDIVIKNKRYSVSLPLKESHCKDSGGDCYKIVYHESIINALKASHKSAGCNSELQVIHSMDTSAYKLKLKCTPCNFEHDIVNPENSKGLDECSITFFGRRVPFLFPMPLKGGPMKLNKFSLFFCEILIFLREGL